MNPGFKIKMVKVYQAVTFEGASHTYFTNSEYLSVRSNKNEQNIQEYENGSIIVRSAKDMVKVGPANIAFIQYDQLKPTKDSPFNHDIMKEEAERAAKAAAEADKERKLAETMAREKATMAEMRATAEKETKALREAQKSARMATKGT